MSRSRSISTRTCPECGAEFTPQHPNARYCDQHRRKRSVYSPGNKSANASRQLATRRWRHRVAFNDGEIYERLVERDGEQCRICGLVPEPGKHLRVDHDHATGKVRGLLCSPCNLGLGYFRDHPERLRAAAEYLEVKR